VDRDTECEFPKFVEIRNISHGVLPKNTKERVQLDLIKHLGMNFSCN